MDSLITQPITLVALMTAIVVTAYELLTARQAAECPECPHCRAAVREREARQRELQEEYARRNRLQGEDDDRWIG